jgi:membrane protease YdiL (CAAX protease family)
VKKIRKEVSALLELGILFLPGIPALIWLWPDIHDENIRYILQSIAYMYVLAGVLVIGLRRWSWYQLGMNRRGIILSLGCGSIAIAERIIVHLTLAVPLNFVPFQVWRFAWDVIFYFCFVGFVEELLFRGLLFRSLEDGFGAVAAVLGSSVAFALWHIGWAGPFLIGHFLIGIFFGLIRLRAGSIAGLIFIHGLDDLIAVETAKPITLDVVQQALHFQVADPKYAVIGDLLLLGVMVYLVFVHPRIQRGTRDPKSEGLPK